VYCLNKTFTYYSFEIFITTGLIAVNSFVFSRNGNFNWLEWRMAGISYCLVLYFVVIDRELLSLYTNIFCFGVKQTLPNKLCLQCINSGSNGLKRDVILMSTNSCIVSYKRVTTQQKTSRRHVIRNGLKLCITWRNPL
jgi:hypothetical protein